jgi:hypothetical protein
VARRVGGDGEIVSRYLAWKRERESRSPSGSIEPISGQV